MTKVAETIEKAEVPADEKQQLADLVRDQVRRYAAEYRAQLVRYYRAFRTLNTASQEALRVAVAQMASDSSPFADFLGAIDRNPQLEIEQPLSRPDDRGALRIRDVSQRRRSSRRRMRPELGKYKCNPRPAPRRPWSRRVRSADKVEPPLLPMNDAREGALPRPVAWPCTWCAGDKGSYGALVEQWLQSIKLPEYQHAPFLAPIEQLSSMGKHEIQRILETEWCDRMLPDVQRVASRFPFDPKATEDVTPRELTELSFHPLTGKFFDLFLSLLREPVTVLEDGAPIRARRSARSSLALPADIYAVTSAVGLVKDRLWDETGKPTPITVRIATAGCRSSTAPNPRAALTIVYLNVGDTHVFDFNQKPRGSRPSTSTGLDQGEQRSRLASSSPDLDTKENSFPEPTVSEGSPWSLLHLLRLAEASPVVQPSECLRVHALADPSPAVRVSKRRTRASAS